MYEKKSVFKLFGPKGRSASKFTLVPLVFTLLAFFWFFDKKCSKILLYGEDFVACVAFCPLKTNRFSSCHLPINLTLSRNNQQNHLRSSHQYCYPSKPNNDKLEKAGWVSHWCIYQGRMSSNKRAQSNRNTVAENTVWLLRTGALKRLLVDLERTLKS